MQHMSLTEQMMHCSHIPQQQQNPHVNQHEVNLKHISIVLIPKLMEGILFSRYHSRSFKQL